jgi:hypothetical protein
MDTFRATAFYLALWYAVLTAFGAVLLIVLNDVEPATGFLIAANVALLFALVLIVAVARLTRHITRGPFWRTLPAGQRPVSEAGLQVARRALHDTWLTFAKGAAAVAIVLSGLAYASNGVSATAWAKAVRAPATQTQSGKPGWMRYRSALLLPTN